MEKNMITQAELQQDYDYHLAQKTAEILFTPFR